MTKTSQFIFTTTVSTKSSQPSQINFTKFHYINQSVATVTVFTLQSAVLSSQPSQFILTKCSDIYQIITTVTVISTKALQFIFTKCSYTNKLSKSSQYNFSKYSNNALITSRWKTTLLNSVDFVKIILCFKNEIH